MSANPNHTELLEILAHFKAVAECCLKDKRGHRWANLLTVTMANAAERCSACEGFYRGETRLAPNELIAHELEREGGLLRFLVSARDHAATLQLPNENEVNGLGYATLALGSFLDDIGRALPEYRVSPDAMALIGALRDCTKDASAAKRDALRSAIGNYLWELAEVAYRLSIAEYRIWSEHREWEISGYEDDRNGPYDVRGIFDNLYAELKRYDDNHPHAFDLMRTSLAGLSELRDNLPVVFVRGDPASDRAYLFADAVRASLTLPTRIFFENPVEAALGNDDPVSNCETSPFLVHARFEFLSGLNSLLQERAKAAKDQTLRRKWYEATAELMVQFSWGQPVFTPEQADRLIALADAAQREAWIQRRMKSPGETEKLPLAPPPPKEPQKVEARLDEDTNRLLREFIESARAARENPQPKKGGGKKTDGKDNPRKGLHGPKKKKMEQQLTAFTNFIEEKKKDPLSVFMLSESVNAMALSFWNKNKKSFQRASKAKGEKKGYGSHTALANAYRNAYRK